MKANFEGVVAQFGHSLHVQEAEAGANVGSATVNGAWTERAEPSVETQYLIACKVRTVLVLIQLVFSEGRLAERLAHYYTKFSLLLGGGARENP